jgi:RNA polymerase sigma-70 factor (ECF subfamily)
MELLQDLSEELRQARHRFLQRTETVRPDLHRYCRALTGTVWDAEDLVQDTLLRAFAKLGEVNEQITNPKAYLLRIASHLWIDHFRHSQAIAPEEPSLPRSPEQVMEIRDAAKQLLHCLPPQERAAIVLKEVFDLHLEEIATMLQTTVGAVKAALHRGREKLVTPNFPRPLSPPSEALLDHFVEAFNARDLDRLAALLRTDAVGEVISMGTSHGRTAIRNSSLYYSLFLERGEPRAERRLFLGEPIVVIWYALSDPGVPVVRDVLRFEELEGQITRLRFFAFCPETLTAIVEALGLPVQTNGYGVWAPAFLEMQKQEEFQLWMAQQTQTLQH